MADQRIPSLAEMESDLANEVDERIVTHIGHTSQVGCFRNRAWCGADIQYTFRFGNIDHAAYTMLTGASRLRICRECVTGIVRAMQSDWTLVGARNQCRVWSSMGAIGPGVHPMQQCQNIAIAGSSLCEFHTAAFQG